MVRRLDLSFFAAVALNNLGVLLLLWLVSATWLFYARRAEIPGKRACRWALFCYLFFFAKEMIRVARVLAAFSGRVNLPWARLFFTLILPHGAVEYTAFALGAAFALAWLGRSLERKRRYYPGHPAVFIPAGMVLLAAVIETVVTPSLFKIQL